MGSHLGLNFDGTDFMIGANSHFGINAGARQIVGNPSVDFYLFQDNFSVYRINLDVVLPLAQGSFAPFAGLGVAIIILKLDEAAPGIGTSDSDFGLNLRFGAFFGDREAAIRPFADGAITVGDNTSFAARGGASFRISR